MTQQLLVPDIGDFSDIPVIEILVKVGDRVEVEQSLVTLESDKATMEVPASHAGVVTALHVKLGDKVSKGALVVSIDASAQAAPAQVQAAPAQAAPAAAVAAPAAAVAAPATPTRSPAPVPAAAPAPTQSSGPATAAAPPQGSFVAAHASPSVRKFARELGVDLALVKGSADKGRITQADVQAFVKQALTQGSTAKNTEGAGLGLLPWPNPDFSKFGSFEKKPLPRIKKISGANLHRNWVMIPHVTNCDEADITELEAFRVLLNKENEKKGIKVTMLAFLIKASVMALKKFPNFNTSLIAEELVHKHYYHIGFAADTPNGLVVPVIRDADKKGIFEISKEMGELAGLAREGKLKPEQMQGGCFSISSLGGIGGTTFTPIINAPEVAIMGVCKSEIKPKWDGSAFQPRLMLPLSLSWDHRVIDGAEAARFNVYFASLLADFRRAVL
ncbi:MAG: dihydrolipoyllysine-residue acetyltransferase [Pseudomonadota bacterium]|jgi:pyruvate dehydrogenase E2 component (dihydrolipoamide acetyltransferase)